MRYQSFPPPIHEVTHPFCAVPRSEAACTSPRDVPLLEILPKYRLSDLGEFLKTAVPPLRFTQEKKEAKEVKTLSLSCTIRYQICRVSGQC